MTSAISNEDIFSRPCVQRLIGDIASTCMKNNIAFKLTTGCYVESQIGKCSGYFSGGGDRQALVVSNPRNSITRLGILIHESCHMDQYLEKAKVWRNVGGEHYVYIANWANNPRSRKGGLECFKAVVKLELDCEKRVCRKIREYKLPLDIPEYIQNANYYLFTYIIAKAERRWAGMGENDKDGYKKMPKRFLGLEHYLNPEHPLLDAFPVK